MSIILDGTIKKAVDLVVMDIETSAKRMEILCPGTKDRVIREIIAGLKQLLRDEPVEIHCDASEGRCAEDDTCDKNAVKVDTDPLLCTADLMASSDYKDRFKAEYRQVKIRYGRLHTMCNKYEAGTLDFEPSCSLELLKEQKAAMGQYLHILEVRAEIEGITL